MVVLLQEKNFGPNVIYYVFWECGRASCRRGRPGSLLWRCHRIYSLFTTHLRQVDLKSTSGRLSSQPRPHRPLSLHTTNGTTPNEYVFIFRHIPELLNVFHQEGPGGSSINKKAKTWNYDWKAIGTWGLDVVAIGFVYLQNGTNAPSRTKHNQTKPNEPNRTNREEPNEPDLSYFMIWRVPLDQPTPNDNDQGTQRNKKTKM